MNQIELKKLLEQVAQGGITVEEAVLALREAPYRDLGYAKIDGHRGIRQGAAEVIYGPGKTSDQIAGITAELLAQGEKTLLITRLESEKAARVQEKVPLEYSPQGRIAVAGIMPEPAVSGKILVVTGGTSDIPVAEEAAITAQALGNPVERLYDVGVAGLHRLLSHLDTLMSARVIIAIAGMEGALASVVGGLADCPVIAVPTSVGYGASFGGVSALLSMLNSCASGVSVVNIDNGFGAGFLASRINHMGG